jgi:hypothetical protein
MFDNLRDEAHSFDEEQTKFQRASTTTTSGPIARRPSRFLGMTSIQRFVIAVLLMMAVCVLGLMCLFVTGKIGL